MTPSDAVHVLLVEDDPRDAELTLEALGRELSGTRALVVANGAEALEYVFPTSDEPTRRRAADLRLILLDLKLPRVGGMEVLRRVKSDPALRHVPVVVLTSSREMRDIRECYRLGANSYMVKPVNFDDFMTCVSRIGQYWLECNEQPAVS